jgi:hypothetical protein
MKSSIIIELLKVLNDKRDAVRSQKYEDSAILRDREKELLKHLADIGVKDIRGYFMDNYGYDYGFVLDNYKAISRQLKLDELDIK